jgi:hypothetical protein
MFRKVERGASAGFLRRRRRVDHDELQVNCGRCVTSMIVRLAEIVGKRLVDCVDCEREGQSRNVPRLVRDSNATA